MPFLITLLIFYMLPLWNNSATAMSAIVPGRIGIICSFDGFLTDVDAVEFAALRCAVNTVCHVVDLDIDVYQKHIGNQTSILDSTFHAELGQYLPETVHARIRCEQARERKELHAQLGRVPRNTNIQAIKLLSSKRNLLKTQFALMSKDSQSLISDTLQDLGIHDIFDEITWSITYVHPFERACQKLRIQPDHGIFLTHNHHEAEHAAKIGMFVVLVPTQFTQAQVNQMAPISRMSNLGPEPTVEQIFSKIIDITNAIKWLDA